MHPPSFQEPEKWLSHVRLLRYQQGSDPVTSVLTFMTPAPYFLSPTQNKNKPYHAPAQLKEIACPYINVLLWQSSVHTTYAFSDEGCLTLQHRGDARALPGLALSCLLSISVLTPSCVHNLISKQGVDSHYGKPGKWPGHFPLYLGSPSGEGTLTLTAPLVQSLCVFWAYAAAMAFTLHWPQWNWPTRLTLFESTTHFNNVTKHNRVLMLNKTFLRTAQRENGI